MAFTNRLLIVVPSFGQPIQNDTLFLKAGTAVASGTVTTSLSGLTPALKQGWIRIKLSASSGAGTVTSIVVTVTDGTITENTWTETLVSNSSFQSPNQVVRTIPFLTDTAGITQVNVITVLAVAGGTLDIEVAGGN